MTIIRTTKIVAMIGLNDGPANESCQLNQVHSSSPVSNVTAGGASFA
jgi:hypothetical protein